MERLTFTDKPALKPWVHSTEAIKRLAAYEDTGLEPEGYKASADALRNLDVNHMHDLLVAEQDGRLVVLPCKVGDTLYYTANGEIKETEVDAIHQWVSGCWKLSTHTDRQSPYWTGYEIDFAAVGKTVFLTREEAEAALEGDETHEQRTDVQQQNGSVVNPAGTL